MIIYVCMQIYVYIHICICICNYRICHIWSLLKAVQPAREIPSDLDIGQAGSQVASPSCPKAPSEVVVNETVKQIEGWQARLSWGENW